MQRLSQSPTDPAFVQNPYPFYALARAAGDLVWWEEYDMAVATSHAAVSALLRDPNLGREQPAEQVQPVPPHLAPFFAVEAHSMLERDGATHRRLRGLVLRAFTSRRIAALTPEITALCHALIDDFPVGEFDLLAAYATPIPVIVIARLLGVPDGMTTQLLAWSSAMVGMYQAARTRQMEESASRAATDFHAYLTNHIAARRSAPADDLITQLIAARDETGQLTDDEMISTCILLLNAGHEATVHTLGIAVKTLLEHGKKPAPTDAVVEEILRYDPPLHLFTRWVLRDCQLFGHHFNRGDQIGLLLASSGRDNAVWPDADHFDPSRPATQHHAFGAGAHFCLGAPLARLELGIALKVLFERCTNLQMTGSPDFAPIYHFHGLNSLTVTCQDSAAASVATAE